jgi:hypothetical protein
MNIIGFDQSCKIRCFANEYERAEENLRHMEQRRRRQTLVHPSQNQIQCFKILLLLAIQCGSEGCGVVVASGGGFFPWRLVFCFVKKS